VDSFPLTVALGEQFAISGRKLLNALGECHPPVVLILIGHLRMSFNQQKVHVSTEVEPLAKPTTDEVRHLPTSNTARPREESTLPVEFCEFVPQNQCRLLIEVIGVVDIRDE
jgi:hypothetical protein